MVDSGGSSGHLVLSTAHVFGAWRLPLPGNRSDFLVAMYDRVWANIDRQITLSWQPLTVVVGLAALLKAAFDAVIPFGMATAFGLIVLTWFLGHVYDCNRWFARNMVIVSNIERYFGREGDQEDINPFMGRLRSQKSASALLSTFQIHAFLAYASGGALLLINWLAESRPFVTEGAKPMFMGTPAGWVAWLPVIGLAIGIGYLAYIRQQDRREYERIYGPAKAARDKSTWYPHDE